MSGRLSLKVTVLVRSHLTETEHCVLTTQAVVVRLLLAMNARVGRTARLRRCELFEPGGHDGVQLLVVSAVCDHFVRVRTDKVTLQTVEMGCLILTCAWKITCFLDQWKLKFKCGVYLLSNLGHYLDSQYFLLQKVEYLLKQCIFKLWGRNINLLNLTILT